MIVHTYRYRFKTSISKTDVNRFWFIKFSFLCSFIVIAIQCQFNNIHILNSLTEGRSGFRFNYVIILLLIKYQNKIIGLCISNSLLITYLCVKVSHWYLLAIMCIVPSVQCHAKRGFATKTSVSITNVCSFWFIKFSSLFCSPVLDFIDICMSLLCSFTFTAHCQFDNIHIIINHIELSEERSGNGFNYVNCFASQKISK